MSEPNGDSVKPTAAIVQVMADFKCIKEGMQALGYNPRQDEVAGIVNTLIEAGAYNFEINNERARSQG